MADRILVIGGVAAGATGAAKARRTSETAEITLIEKGKYISFANCGLPYYTGGVIKKACKCTASHQTVIRQEVQRQC